MAYILIVEDDPDVRQLLTMLLQRTGYRTIVASNGAEALALSRRFLPDLVIMDLMLPIVDGWTAIWRLKSDPVTAHISVLALTAHALTDDKSRARAAGCDAFMTKPFEVGPFLTEVAALVDRSRQVGGTR